METFRLSSGFERRFFSTPALCGLLGLIVLHLSVTATGGLLLSFDVAIHRFFCIDGFILGVLLKKWVQNVVNYNPWPLGTIENKWMKCLQGTQAR